VTPEPRSAAAGWVAVILAVALGLALNLIVGAVLYDAIFSEGPGLSENATQILTGAFGGIIGVLGSYIGYRAAATGPGQPPRTPSNGLQPPSGGGYTPEGVEGLTGQSERSGDIRPGQEA